MKLKQTQIQQSRAIHQENMNTARATLLDSNKFKAKKLKKSREKLCLRTTKIKNKELERRKLAVKQEKLTTTSHKSERATKDRVSQINDTVDEGQKLIKKKEKEIKTLSEMELVFMKDTNEIIKRKQQEIDKLVAEIKSPSEKHKMYKERIKKLKAAIYDTKPN